MTQTSLSPARVDELVASYESGATHVELAERFQHSSLLRDGAPCPPLDPDPPTGLDECHLAEAVELYDEGLPLMEVGLRFGVIQQAVRRALAADGVTIRPGGRRAQPSQRPSELRVRQ